MTEQGDRLARYLDLIEQERECRPSEAMLADEIVRLREIIRDLLRECVRYTPGHVSEAITRRASEAVR